MIRTDDGCAGTRPLPPPRHAPLRPCAGALLAPRRPRPPPSLVPDTTLALALALGSVAKSTATSAVSRPAGCCGGYIGGGYTRLRWVGIRRTEGEEGCERDRGGMAVQASVAGEAVLGWSRGATSGVAGEAVLGRSRSATSSVAGEAVLG